MARPFLAWLREESCLDFEELTVDHVRRLRVPAAGQARPGDGGQDHPRLSPGNLDLLRWAALEGYPVDGRILLLKPPRVPQSEPDVFHLAQLRKILAARNPRGARECWRTAMDLTDRMAVELGRKERRRALESLVRPSQPRASRFSHRASTVPERFSSPTV